MLPVFLIKLKYNFDEKKILIESFFIITSINLYNLYLYHHKFVIKNLFNQSLTLEILRHKKIR